MSAQEFQHWRVMYRTEGWHPRSAQMRHAQVLAATYQGPSTRRGSKQWLAADFLPPDPWAPPAPRKFMKGRDVLAFAVRENKRRMNR